jgi:hypothetical protein
MSYIRITFIGIIFLSVSLSGCSQKSGKAAITPEQQGAKTQMDSLDKIAEQTAKTYKAMDNATLLKKLVEQSKLKKEPFNSLAFRELKERKDVNAESLLSAIRELKNGDALLPLVLLRKLNEKAYAEIPVELRAEILTDALEHSKTFNTWGLPPFYTEDAGKALIECEKSAYPALKRMLAEKGPAPVFGSKEYMVYQRYQYRLCDYALFFIEKIEGSKDFVMPITPAGRDSLISKL